MNASRTFLLLALSAASACAAARAEGPPPGAAAGSGALPPAAKAKRVDGAVAEALVKEGARLVDVRTPQEFASGHVPGAVNVPYDEVERRAAEIGPPSAPVVLYCRTGRRSGVAAETLERLGYTHVYDLGPMTAWPGTPQ